MGDCEQQLLKNEAYDCWILNYASTYRLYVSCIRGTERRKVLLRVGQQKQNYTMVLQS